MTAAHHSVGIIGTGSYLPKEEITNSDVASKAGVTEEWIQRKTQIITRRYAAPDEATSDLAVQAAVAALDDANLTPDRLDYIVVATSTPDSPQPPTAALVQHELEAYKAGCWDLNAVCSGFPYAVALAEALLARHPGSHALVVAADVYSRCLNFGDRTTSVLLGDGAGAVVLGSVPADRGIIAASLRTRGDMHELIKVPAGGSRLPASHDTVDRGEHCFTMQGRQVAEFVLHQVPPAITELLDRAGMSVDDLHHFVPHQPNGNLLDQLVTQANLTPLRTHRTLEKYGNIGAACIPVTLDEANRAGAIADRDMLLLAGFGGGMSIGLALVRWSA